jgi:hypothetical protein
MLDAGEGRHVTVAAGAVAALICWNDGQRTLVGLDGFTLTLDPERWPDGAAVVAAIEAGIDPRVRVGMDSAGPSRRRPAAPRPSPAPPPAAAPARLSVLERFVRLRGLVLVWLLVGVSGLFQAGQGHVVTGVVLTAAAAVALGGQQALVRHLARRRRARSG